MKNLYFCDCKVEFAVYGMFGGNHKMSITCCLRTINSVNNMQLRINHFAFGTYPEARGGLQALPHNRFFIPVANPNGKKCYICDQASHYTLRAGYAYFIPLFHCAEVCLDDRLTFFSVQFNLELYDGIDLFSHSHAIRALEDISWLERIKEVFENRSPFASASLLAAVTQNFAGILLNGMTEDELMPVTKFTDFLPELDYAKKHCAATTTVQDLISVRGFRREVFTRNFTRAVGISPKQFLTRCLVNRACKLLLRKNLLAREVAFELGFRNEFYFSRFFRKHTGMPPHRYQKFYAE